MLPVSVVIPCFRCAATIERAVESVWSQTSVPRELVLVDDASGDDTLPAIQRLAIELRRRIRVTVIPLPANVGAASARNAGWDAAREEYVAFLDADATWFPRKLEVQYRLMEEDPGIVLSGHRHVISPPSVPVLADANRAVLRLTFRDFLWRNRFITSSAMIRKTVPLRFQEGQRHMEDHRLWLDVARANLGIARIECELAAHYKPDYGAGGLSADLLAMERAELGNYESLLRRGAVGLPMFAVLCAWSLLKFMRRLAIVAARPLLGQSREIG